jgi:hypothetical protein
MSAYRLGIRKRVSIIAALVTLPCGTATAGVSKNNLHFSMKKGRIVRMQPSGASFELPEGRSGWLVLRAIRVGQSEARKRGVVYRVREDSERCTAI